jgi:hypothetical protein
MKTKTLKRIAKVLKATKQTALNSYEGYELLTANEILMWLEEGFMIELLKDHDIQTVQAFQQACSLDDES